MLRSNPVGRALALLILGIALGVTLFVMRHLQPNAVKELVDDALRGILQAKFSYRVKLNLATGIELKDLKVYYPDGVRAIEAERVVLTVDHQKLLGGDVVLRQVDFEGLRVRLRPAGKDDRIPSLPGIFKPVRGTRPLDPHTFPLVRVRPGRTASWIEILAAGPLARASRLRLDCLGASARGEHDLLKLQVTFAGKRMQRCKVEARYDPGKEALRIDARAEGLVFTRRDPELLQDSIRSRLPPIVLEGKANLEAHASVRVRPFVLAGYSVHAALRDLEGRFGDIYTGTAVGLPYRITHGEAILELVNGRLAVPRILAAYVAPDGTQGTLDGSFRIDLEAPDPDLDLHLNGTGIRASTGDLRHLLPPDVVEAIIEEFLPSGTFDLDLDLSRRPFQHEKVLTRLKMRDGTFDYAGPFNERAGRRYGFRYPLLHCTASIEVETHVATPQGDAERIAIRDLRGSSPVADPRPGRPKTLAVKAAATVLTYATPDGVARQDADIAILLNNLPIDEKLSAAFASTARGSPYDAFDLHGRADRVRIHIVRDGFGANEALASYDIHLADCALAYERFPLRIEKVHGRITSRELEGGGRLLRIEALTGEAAGGGRIQASGRIMQAPDGTEHPEISIHADDLALGPALEKALSLLPNAEAGLRRLWSKLRPAGTVDATVVIHAPDETRVEIDLGGTAEVGGYGKLACPVTALQGKVLLTGGKVTLKALQGGFCGARLNLDGTLFESGALTLDCEILGLPMHAAVRRLTHDHLPRVAGIIERYRIAPTSTLDLQLHLERAAEADPIVVKTRFGRLDLEGEVRGIPVRLRGGPVALRGGRLQGRDLWLRSGGGSVHVREFDFPGGEGDYGWAVLDAQGLSTGEHLNRLLGPGLEEILGPNLRADLHGFRVELHLAERMVVLSGAVDLRRHELLEKPIPALEPTGALGLTPLTLHLPDQEGGPLEMSGVIEFHGLNMNLPIDVGEMSGELRLASGSLGPAFRLHGAVSGGELTVYRRHLAGLALNLTVAPHYLRLGNIEASFYGGTFRGDLDVHLGAPAAFKVRMQVKDVELGEMLKQDLPRDEPLSGTMDGALEFESPSGEPWDMRGEGEVKVRDGQLFEVPGLRRILAVIARAAPLDRSRFRTAEVELAIEGETIRVHRFHLATRVNDVRGEGTLSIYGDLNLVVRPQVTRLIDLPRLVNIPFLSALRDLWHKAVYEIRLEGTLDSPVLRLRGLPFLRGKVRPFPQSRHAGRAKRMRPRVIPR